ncbi:ABC transporter permease [Flavihumibacter rivuli]|uniref:ABC transporter permease n=1 Tax=Flavihumibacter rivuli TaxID=2838156 RepID=UPI001BDED3DA|nr:ABC transporter permease [Flavihumibacter rivuli]ULQ57886.1 ABC transporter permease [Flavihumibacter rivuli]
MFLNYLKIAIRNLQRHRSHALLNIAGLAIALAAGIIIFLVLQHEFSYDRYHKNADNVYQVVKRSFTPDDESFEVAMPFPVKKALEADYPDILFTQVFTSFGSQITVIEKNNTIGKKFLEGNGIYFSESSLPKVFDMNFLAGSPAILEEPGKAVISQEWAEKYFGTWKEALGRKLKLNNSIDVEIAAVIANPPVNSDFQFRLLPSYKTFVANKDNYGFTDDLESWGASTSNHQVYALFPEGKTEAVMNKALAAFSKRHYEPEAIHKNDYFLHPLKNVHFDTRFSNNGDHISSKASLYTLAFIGILIILMACINFINLSTALAVKRSKEVGIRKVMGSSRGQLVAQVLIETGLIVAGAAILAILLAWISLPYLKYITDIQNNLSLFNKGSIAFILLIIIATTLLSGMYPATVLARFQPVEAIKNKINNTRVAGLSLRRVLVVLQFAFAQLLIIATIIAVSQMNFIRNADIGFKKDAILLLYGNNDSLSLAKHEAFRNDLQKLPQVKSVAFGFDAPSSQNTWSSNFAFDHRGKDEPFNVFLKFGDGHYLKTFGLELLAGEFYKNEDSARKVVINATMAKKLGLKKPEEAVGKQVRLGGNKWIDIVGVVKDFKNTTLRDAIQPTIITRSSRFMSMTAIKLQTSQFGKANEMVQQVWEKHYPEYAYNSAYMDETINNFYRQEERLSRLYKVYALLAIIISCLGLYGLVSFMAVQKTKEVGIRKVLGASTGNIVLLFSKEFTLLILLAFLLAAPIGWWMMNNWLQNFVFRIEISWVVFALAILSSIIIAWVTVGYRAIRAGLANPIKSLRNE